MAVAIASIVILFFLIKSVKFSKQSPHYIYIQLTIFVCFALRVFLWFFWMWGYAENSAFDKSCKVLNRICLFLNYLALSLFVETWIRVIVVVNHLKYDRFAKWSFVVLNGAVFMFFVVAIVYVYVGSTQ